MAIVSPGQHPTFDRIPEPAHIVSDPSRSARDARFRFLDLTLSGIHENLALEEALLLETEEQELPPLLRFWELTEPAVVLGASRSLLDDVHEAACRAEGIPIARRSSGGGTVVVGPGALNISLFLPLGYAAELSSPDQAQVFVLQKIARALAQAAPTLTVQGSGDLTLLGRKVAGSAQRRLRRTVLVHASLLYAFDLTRIGRWLTVPSRQPSYRAGRSHEEFVTVLQLPRRRIQEAICSEWLGPEGTAAPALVPEDRTRALLTSVFGTREWVERF